MEKIERGKNFSFRNKKGETISPFKNSLFLFWKQWNIVQKTEKKIPKKEKKMTLRSHRNKHREIKIHAKYKIFVIFWQNPLGKKSLCTAKLIPREIPNFGGPGNLIHAEIYPRKVI